MKPNYQNVWGLSFIDQGYRGVYRWLGNPIKVVEPGRVWGLPILFDVAKVDIRPQSKEVELNVVSKDQQNFNVSPRLYHWVTNPMDFLDRAPVDYENQLVGILRHEIEGEVPRKYNLKELMDARADLARHLSSQLNGYLNEQRWGLDVDVFVPELIYPSVSPSEIDVRKIQRDQALPLQKQLKELEAEIAGLEARKFAETQQQIAEGYRILITGIMAAKAVGMERLSQAYSKVAEAILGPYADRLDPSYVAWVLNGVVKDAISAQSGNEALEGIEAEVEEKIRASLSGEAIQERASKGGISPTLASILDTAEGIIPKLSSKTSLEDIDQILNERLKGQ